jgi:4-aminobutyrate aminotransferase-like enzyme/Ser/Thr protein kinase RdoA (MazF antagonist)
MLLLDHTPTFETDAVASLVQELYGIQAGITPMPSERDQNFLLSKESGEKFILKIANAIEERSMLDAQHQALSHLAQFLSLCPQVVPTGSGENIAQVGSRSGSKHFVRLVTYLPGMPLASIHRHSPELLCDLGRRIGEVDRALENFDHKALHRDFHWDLANALSVFYEYEELIEDSELRKLVGKLAADFERDVVPLLANLRRSLIHNDANDYNVLVGGGNDLYTRNQSILGLIDFGDMCYSYTVGDLAVAVAYAILNKPNPLPAAAQIVRGYHAEYPLEEEEIAALWGFVLMRLCMSVCIARHQQSQRPDDDYLSVSQVSISRTLPRLARIHPRFAEATFRHVCGLRSVPSSTPVIEWLVANKDTFASVLDADLRTMPFVVFDLSISSPLISADPQENKELRLTKRLCEVVSAADVRLGIGRYDEPRLLYTASAFASGADARDERRVVHLGMDLFDEAGTPVYAPLNGKVHAFANNQASQDYGPVIVLQHVTDDDHKFYTLYGHLSEGSLSGLSIGKRIAKGEQFGKIGAPVINGDWPPHLHFQLIIDLLDLDCDFPGVVLASEREVWRSLSPDPNLILRIPADGFPPKAPSTTHTLAERRQRLGRNLSIAYRNPVKVARGWMQYLYDDDGRRYLDAYNNVPHVGHCHPQVVKAGQEQMAVLNTNTRYLHDRINEYAEKLCSLLPETLSVCFFVNSGSEANELALRLSRAHTRQRDLIVLEGAYHGHTNTLIDISPYKHNGSGGIGAPSWVHTAPQADVYRGLYRRDDPQAGAKYAQLVTEIIERLRAEGRGLAGFIAESFPSVGGQIVFPERYLLRVYAAVRDAGGVCIADEVQTGLGRLGTDFWGFEAHVVVPDIVVLGKPIGNGHPVGAVITTPDIAASFDNGMEFFSTFGGNTVSCAIGLAVLRVVHEEGLQSHALRVGNHMLDGLRQLAERYPIIGDVRGSGLFLGVELVRDRETLEPAAEEASFIINRMRDCGILLGTEGPLHNVLKIRPPMPFSDIDAELLMMKVDRILAEDFGASSREL